MNNTQNPAGRGLGVPCECGDYHAGDDDHHALGVRCPREATQWFPGGPRGGGVALCDECADAEVD